jgi:flagellar basal-body rod protein FlgC
MDYNESFAISATGMAVEKLRLDVAAANLANMNSSAPSVAQLYRPSAVVATENPLGFPRQFSSLAASAGGVRGVGVQAMQAAPRMVHEPGHPHAGTKGYVAYPGVDHSTQMVNISSALRAYEANVVAMNAARIMAARTLEIGGPQ